MYSRIDASKSTKGASKLRRDLINAEIANLRDLLPLPPSTRQRLSQLQLMALVCVFLRKANYFQQALKNYPSDNSSIPTPNIGFSKAMAGFIMMMTQQGKLLYISENAAEYLGHSMEDLLIHGDSVYDVIDKQDHVIVQSQLARNNSDSNDRRLFLCRINVSRNSRRQLRFGDQKVVLVEGHFLPFIPVCSRNDFVFLASCTPVVLPETRESIVQGATNIFTSIHSMDMKYLHVDKTAECHMEYSRAELIGVSWYNLLHWDSVRTAYCKHQTVIQSDQERSSTALLRLQTRTGKWFWVHCVLQVKDTSEDCQHPIIVCTNQVLSDKEAEVMRSSNWLYRYSSQTKFTYALCPGNQTSCMSYVTQSDRQQQKHGNDSLNRPIVCDINAPNEFYLISRLESRELRRTTIPLRDDAEPVDMSISSVDHDITERSTHAPLQSTIALHSHRGEHVVKIATHTAVSANTTVPVATTNTVTMATTSPATVTTASLTTPASAVTSTTTSSTSISSAETTASTMQTTITVTKSTTSATGKYRAKFLQYQSEFSTAASLKYYITDLDKDPYLDRESAATNSVYKRLPAKIFPGTIGPMESVEPQESPVDQWNSSSTWFEIPQRVPDLIHHDLSPYVVTPTTPTEHQTPNSEIHTDTQIFNFDWPIEQHVPNLKLTLQSTGYDPRKHQETIALQLPRRRSHAIDRAKDFLK